MTVPAVTPPPRLLSSGLVPGRHQRRGRPGSTAASSRTVILPTPPGYWREWETGRRNVLLVVQAQGLRTAVPRSDLEKGRF